MLGLLFYGPVGPKTESPIDYRHRDSRRRTPLSLYSLCPRISLFPHPDVTLRCILQHPREKPYPPAKNIKSEGPGTIPRHAAKSPNFFDE